MEGNAELEDLAAIHRVLAGDRASFRPLVEKYGERVRRFCRSRLPSEDDAEDAAQETFLRAYRSLPSFRLGESFPAWLFSIAANRAKTRALGFATERGRVIAAAAEAATAAPRDPVAEVEREGEAAALRAALASLPLDQREVVELYYFADLAVAETARVLGIGEEAVKSRLFRSRKRLRELLESPQRAAVAGGILE